MNYTRWLIGLAILLATFARPAVARQEAPAGWRASVEAFALELVEQGGVDSLRNVLQERHTVRDLQCSERPLQSLVDLAIGVDWARPLVYRELPDALASDLAALVVDSPLTDSLKRYLTPRDELALRQANSTAMRWVGQMLRARNDQPVGVLLLHRPAKTEGSAGTLVVVLLAGERVGYERFLIKHVAFGEFSPQR